MSNSKKVVVVLGMHRSGTSAIARGLKVLSVDLGNHLMPGIPGENDKGFFEDVDIQKFNERLLAKSNSAWHSLSQVPTRSFETHVYAAERFEAAELIGRKFANTQTFGFKDPRTALLLPFWQCIFKDLGISDSYLIAVRNPLEVAESLRKRGQTDPTHSALLWLKYNWAAISHSAGRPRVCVSYSRFLDDSFAQLTRVATAFALPMPAPSDPEFSEFAGEFLETKLRHNRISDNEVMRQETLPKIVAPLYQTLVEWADADPEQALDVPPKLRTRVEGFWENTEVILQYGDRVRNSAALARTARAKAESELADVSIAHEETRSLLADTEAKLLMALGENEAAQLRLTEFEKKIAALEADLSETRASLVSSADEVDGLSGQIEQISKANADTLASLSEFKAKAEHLQSELAAREFTIIELQLARSRADRDAADLRRRLDDAETANLEIAARLSESETRIDDLLATATAKDIRLAYLETASADAERNAAELKQMLDSSRNDANRNAAAFDKQLREVTKTHADELSAARVQAQRLKAAAEQISAQLSSAHIELADKTKSVRLLRHALLEIRSSTSWKLTKPLRASKNVLSLPLRAARRMLGGSVNPPPTTGN